MKPLEEITEEHYHQIFDINVLGLLLVSKEAAKHLPKGGSIVNVSSVVSRITPPGSAVYTGTKGAVDAITGVLARELGPRASASIRSIRHDRDRGHSFRRLYRFGLPDWAVGQTPLGRIGQPHDIASVATFLASDDAGWLTGQLLIASGGMQ